MTSSSTGTTHILVFPYPAQGHMLPLLDFTHHLLTHAGAALTVTVVVTPNNLKILQPLLSSHPPSSIAALVLPFPPHPSLPAGAENTQHLPPNSFLSVMSSLHRLRRPLLRWLRSHPSPPSAILSDSFLAWTHRFAAELGIKRLVFCASGAFFLSILLSHWRNLPQPPRTPDGAVVPIDDVPGRPRLLWHQLSTIYRTYASADPAAEFLRSESADNEASWGWVVNTFSDLERPYLSHLTGALGHERLWAVGPVNGFGCGSAPVERHVLSWLDTCGDQEVVYVCFGSQAVLPNEQMEVIALAIERSGARFVWKIKEPNEGHVSGERFGKLPSGFEGRVAGRGLVVRDWAPQVSILRHRAVGAFLTHCGWNSVLEGLSAGTMMLMWPQGADQFCNMKLLEEQLKAGVRVSREDRSLPDPDELARVLAGSVSGAYKEQRSKALELKTRAAEALSEGGSSLMAVGDLIQRLPKLPARMQMLSRDVRGGLRRRKRRLLIVNGELRQRIMYSLKRRCGRCL